MAKTNYQSIDEYHNAFSPEVALRLQQVRNIIHDIVPEVEETISYQIPCFKYKGYLIYYAAFPNHITLSHPFSPAFLQHFHAQLANYKLSKAALQLPIKDPLPVDFIKAIIQFRKQENESVPAKKKR